jgi:death on curing protein
MYVWIEIELTLAIHERQLAEHGGTSGVRDKGLLESALARPQQMAAYGDPPPDIADLAAALAHGIVRNHPFVDGNKRVALVVCETFVELNGGTLTAEDSDLYRTTHALAEGQFSADDFAKWLRIYLRPTRVNEPVQPYGASPTATPARKRPAARAKKSAQK